MSLYALPPSYQEAWLRWEAKCFLYYLKASLIWLNDSCFWSTGWAQSLSRFWRAMSLLQTIQNENRGTRRFNITLSKAPYRRQRSQWNPAQESVHLRQPLPSGQSQPRCSRVTGSDRGHQSGTFPFQQKGGYFQAAFKVGWLPEGEAPIILRTYGSQTVTKL